MTKKSKERNSEEEKENQRNQDQVHMGLKKNARQ